MALNQEDLRDDYFAAFSESGGDFPWDQRVPFDAALRDALESSPDAVFASHTMNGQTVLILIADDRATLLWVTAEGVTTSYIGSLNGGLLYRTVKREDEMRWVWILRFEHDRLPDGGILDTASTRSGRERQDQLFEHLRPYSNAA